MSSLKPVRNLAALVALALSTLSLSAAAATTLAELEQALQEYGADAAALSALSEGHPLIEALSDKQLRKHRVAVPGADAFYFASDEASVVILVSEPDVVGRYLMPSVRGADFQTLDGRPAVPGKPVPAPLVYTLTDLGWRWLEARITLSPADGAGREVTGAQVDESLIRHYLRVDPVIEPGGPDGLATLAGALKQAEPLLQRGEGVKITVAPGTYREGEIELLSYEWSEAGRNAVLVIEGEGDTPPVISGADDWSGGWEPVEGAENVYRKPWPHKFGLCEQNWESWGYLIDPRVARSEIVTVDGQIMLPSMLEQFAWVDPDGAVPLEETAESKNQPGQWKALGIKDSAKLLPGTFGVVEAEQAIYVCPPEGVDLNAAAVEVSVRPYILNIGGRNNVVLRNLAFVHTATFVGSHVMGVEVNGSNVLIEDCRFDEHGSKAFGITGEKQVGITIRRSTFNGNGWKGLSTGYRTDNVIVEDCESSYNNWRGHTGLQYGWDAAGVKAFAVDTQIGYVIRGHRAFANLTSGYWLDQSFTPRSFVDISDSYFIGNQFGAQLYLEKLAGPVEVNRNVIWNNEGIRGIDGTSWQVNLRNNILYTSSDGQAAIYLHKRGTESEYANYSKDWSMHGNLIVSGAESSPLITDDCTPEQYEEFLATLDANNNVYFGVSPGGAFPLPGGGSGGLDAFRQVTEEDVDSLWADPQFASAEEFNWEVQSSAVSEKLADLPAPLSAEDRVKLDYAVAQSSRFLSITAAAGHASGPEFEIARNVIENNWHPVDLSSVANRPLVGEDAWIGAGNALPHLEAGRHVFAGVPFDIPDPSGNALVGVALKSNKVLTTQGRTLPSSVELPIQKTTPAVYVLHGSGWIDAETAAAATYELVFEDGSTHAVAIKPFNAGVAEPNVGEWYHAFPVFDNQQTRHVSLLPYGQSPGATLYVLEIRNPEPEKTVAALRLRSEPGRNTSVIVLGVTWLAE
ncbi:MAG: right-handed parallel beta-helix repeat-containing protein [Planctomycetota bacterium]